MKRVVTWFGQEIPDILHPHALRQIASHIRDTLDPLVAREGASALEPDDVLTVHTLLVSLQTFRVPLAAIRYSRIHLAVAEMCGKATRWPAKLADEAEAVVRSLELHYGPLMQIKPPLFNTYGRLWRVCEPHETSKAVRVRHFSE
jgi:hypothetical protein